MFLILQSVIFYLISVITAIFIGLYFYLTRNFKIWQELGVPYAKPTVFFGNLKECALLKTTIGEQLQRIYNEHSDKPYVGIFSFDKPSLLIRDLDLVKNILVKDFQTFMDHMALIHEKADPILAYTLPIIKGRLWRHLRTNLTTVFTSRKMKMMFYLVDTSGKELADFLEKATADGKLPHDQSSYKFQCEYTVQKLEKFKAFIRVCVCVCIYIYIFIYKMKICSVILPYSLTFHDALLLKDITHFCYSRA